MARSTRSALQQQEKDGPVENAPTPRIKVASKKRKRGSDGDSDAQEQPVLKQHRADDDVKEEEETEETEVETRPIEDVPSTGDVPLDSSYAEQILDVLEMIDTQGLLDRVFPLPTGSSVVASSSASSTQSYSLRTLLKDASHHTLRVLRSSIQQLFPISSHARSRPDTPAAQQLRFCELALSLLDEASRNSAPFPLDVESILPGVLPATADGDVEMDDASHVPSPDAIPEARAKKRKYALLQRLPTGDWWTSVNSDLASAVDGREPRDLPTAHAELVALLPTPSVPYPSSSAVSQQLTIGALFPRKTAPPRPNLPGARHVSCGSFLDYGPFASFAPTFDQEGVEAGRQAMGDLLFDKALRKRRRARELALMQGMAVEGSRGSDKGVDGAEMEVVEIRENDTLCSSSDKKRGKEKAFDIHISEELFTADEVAAMKSALGSLELQNALQELLDRTTRALVRLQELQLARLGGSNSGSSQVEVGSEEWDVAQGIMDSLATLTSLRPRSTADPSSSAPLVPSASVLHKLHRTIPLGPSQGWYGTLPASKATALRDDATLQVKAGGPTASLNSTQAAVKSTPAATNAYSGYNYPAYTPGQYRPSGYSYTPGQTGAYYPSQYSQAQGQAAGSSYYGNQQYNTPSQANQQYSYPSWYNIQQPAAQTQTQTQTGTNSGRGTPQPSSAAPATNYTAYHNASTPSQQSQPQRAVANTVSKPYALQQSTWTPSTPGYTAPTLPHIRNYATSTPQPASSAAYQQPPSYYSYQAQTTAR